MKHPNPHLILITIALIVAYFFLNIPTSSTQSVVPTDLGGASDVTCGSADTQAWRCGTWGTCTGTFKAIQCCRYYGPTDIVDVPVFDYCDQNRYSSNFIPLSHYGVLRIYLASSVSSGYDSAKLSAFATHLKSLLLTASYGRLDNVEFIIDPLLNDFTHPTVSTSRFGNDIRGAYIIVSLSDDPFVAGSFYQQFNANINWNLQSAAYYNARFPFGFTTVTGNPGQDIDHDTIHEIAHAFFSCNDYDGDNMRPVGSLNRYMNYPPICLERMQVLFPQLVSSVGPTGCTSGATQTCTASNGCTGTQTCSGGAWGSCVQTNPSCGTTVCTSGQTRSCTVGSCAGTQTCSNNAWGGCVKNDPNCGSSGCTTITTMQQFITCHGPISRGDLGLAISSWVGS